MEEGGGALVVQQRHSSIYFVMTVLDTCQRRQRVTATVVGGDGEAAGEVALVAVDAVLPVVDAEDGAAQRRRKLQPGSRLDRPGSCEPRTGSDRARNRSAGASVAGLQILQPGISL